ncbi:MAG: GGDEF domain-containing protein [Chloroflexi bacterium]|nr:GGDEF domain-containing protein [Chloroflexota bacterium]
MEHEVPAGKRRHSPAGRWAGLRSPAAIVLAIVTCLAVVLGIVVVSQVGEQVAREAESQLENHTADQSAALEELMAGVSRDVRLAARNVVFAEALAATSGQLLTPNRRLVEAAIIYLGKRYRVDEICLIRADGRETARWVSGKGIAPVTELSADERLDNPAFIPTMSLPDDGSYQSDPYVSPDANRWVIGVATPIVLATGEHAGVLHFEIPIQRFEHELTGRMFGGSGYGMLLDRSGHLLFGPQLADFRSAQGLPTDPRSAPFPVAGVSGSLSWRQAVATMVGGNLGNVSFVDGGVSFRASYRVIPSSDRIVALASPTVELYANADRDRLILGITVGPLFLLIILVSGFFTSRLSGANRSLASTNQLLGETSRALAHQAMHDALTGLPNRVLFQDRLRHALDRARRPRPEDGACQAVLFLDLDNFKLINDTMGHPTGDELLVAVAEGINASLRPGDTAARLGGDEFTVLLENVTEAEARVVADRVLERLRQPFVLNGHEARVSASIGIVVSTSASDLPEDLMRSADTALCEAKRKWPGPLRDVRYRHDGSRLGSVGARG